jgi:hypothetical protein
MKNKEKASPSPLEQLLGGKKETEKPKAKEGVRHKTTKVEHHFDSDGKSKGHTVRHSPDTPEEVSYTSPDLDGVHDGMEEHLGTPNHDEEGAKA